MSKTVKLISKNFNVINPESIEDYLSVGGFQSLKKIFSLEKEEIYDVVKASGLKGRGGACYPVGLKLQQAAAEIAPSKAVVCNADEGEPGTFKDRSLLEFDPFRVLEGIAMAAYTVDADKAFIYMREEYGKLQKRMNRAIQSATEAGYLGENYLGSGRNLTVKVVSGAGAYVCGEGSAIAESIEGKIGRPRPKPPYIKQCGVFSLPTLVNNVETLSILPLLFSEDAQAYVNSGTEESKGTKIISISGNVNNPGVYEIPFGLTLREIIFDIGGGIRDGKQFKFTQLGGASGPIAPESLLDTKYTYDDLSAVGLSIGSGAVMVADETNSIIDYMETVQDFFAHESCGKCTPCREGTLQLQNIMKRFVNYTASNEDLLLCSKLSNVMKVASFCGLGKSCMAPLLTSLEYFKDEFTERIV